MSLKRDLILAAGVFAAGFVWIEAGHRTELVQIAAAEPDRCASADLRYSAGRLMFFDGGFMAGIDRPRANDRFAYPPECSR